jgi:uncharacterized protein (TIGR02145 family)
MKTISSIIISFLLITSCNSFKNNQSNFDEIGIKTRLNDIANYSTVTLGEQTWLAQNLAVTRFNNGDTIFFAQDAMAWTYASDNNLPAYAYYRFWSPSEESDLESVFYNFYALTDHRGLAPNGWRIPSIDDWDELLKNYVFPEDKIRQIKSIEGWGSYYSGNNISGFNGQPLGKIEAISSFFDANPNAVWWTSNSMNDEEAIRIEITGEDQVIKFETDKDDGLNVRLIKN